MNRMSQFADNYHTAIKRIQEYESDPTMAAITKWILTTDENLFSVFPVGWNILYSAQDCELLLDTIHHALVDDGDISFPVVNGEPRIAFVSRWEDNIDAFILSDAEKEFARRFGREHEITFLDSIDDFIEQRIQYAANLIKKYFVQDAARFGIDFAKENYPTVTNEQIVEWQSEIDERIKLQQRMGI